MACAWLLWNEDVANADEALDTFAKRRTDATKGERQQVGGVFTLMYYTVGSLIKTISLLFSIFYLYSYY